MKPSLKRIEKNEKRCVKGLIFYESSLFAFFLIPDVHWRIFHASYCPGWAASNSNYSSFLSSWMYSTRSHKAEWEMRKFGLLGAIEFLFILILTS
jgi:hypothetical protein